MTDQLPEIREGDAPPEIAALYADIRAVTGIPLVDLFYRHVAALPGALPWVWRLARGPAGFEERPVGERNPRQPHATE